MRTQEYLQGDCHPSRRKITMLAGDGRRLLSQNTTAHFERWKELRAINRCQKQRSFIWVNRRTVAELFAFQSPRDQEIGLRDMVDRIRFDRIDIFQQAPHQINR